MATPESSPCVGVCRLGEDGLCAGCRRTIDEIVQWPGLEAEERLRIMRDVLPRRTLSPPGQIARDVLAIRRAVSPLSVVPVLDKSGAREAAVLVPVVHRSEGLAVLFTCRNAHLREHAGQVSFPGGAIESDDADPVATALRETVEEVGILPEQIEPVGYLDALVTGTGYRIVPVAGFVDGDYRARVNHAEVDSVFEVPLDVVRAPGCLRPLRFEWQGLERETLAFDWDGHHVWGATASILGNLVDRLRAFA